MSLRPSARSEVRRNRYKVAVDAEEGRRRREDNMVEIRKNKREENLLKKRREGLLSQQNQQQQLFSASSVSDKKVFRFNNNPFGISGFAVCLDFESGLFVNFVGGIISGD